MTEVLEVPENPKSPKVGPSMEVEAVTIEVSIRHVRSSGSANDL